MKKILSLTLIALFAIGFTSCSEDSLNTSPTTAVSGESMFETANAALVPLNGLYRMMYEPGWSTGGNTHQCFGISAYNLAADVMGDDHIMSAQGSGWFWFDCIYGIKHRYASSSWRSYDLWNTYYTYISNANYILAAQHTMEGQPSDVNNVIGQAYAIRAYSYFMLAQWFCRTYVGHENEPGVPLYTEPTVAGTEGKPRGTLQDVYVQINNDIDSAIILLNEATPQMHKSHIDKYVANGIKARICLVQERWKDALDAAKIAQGGGEVSNDILGGMNDITKPNIMWGAEIIADQSSVYASFFMHMSHEMAYGQSARKQINKELYAKMGAKDIRLKWWNPADAGNDGKGGYQQMKFRWADLATYTGDYVWMRVEEMVLTEAEALCMLGRDPEAQQVLVNLIKTRDPSYTCTKTGKALGALTTDMTGSLREEIIIQRRIELWGEIGRVFDIRRLKQGFIRTEAQGWPVKALLQGCAVNNPETWDWVVTIPQQEFDSNHSLNFDTDQNPIDVGNPGI